MCLVQEYIGINVNQSFLDKPNRLSWLQFHPVLSLVCFLEDETVQSIRCRVHKPLLQSYRSVPNIFLNIVSVLLSEGMPQQSVSDQLRNGSQIKSLPLRVRDPLRFF